METRVPSDLISGLENNTGNNANEWLSTKVNFTISSTHLDSNGKLYQGTAPFNGFCCIQANNSGTVPSGGWRIMICNITKSITQSTTKSLSGTLGAICPVQKDDIIYVYGNADLQNVKAYYYSI